MSRVISLTKHMIQEQGVHPEATGEFSTIMAQIALVGKIVARDLSHSGLVDMLGLTGETNVQGEAVHKLDQKANDTFVQAFEHSGLVHTLISEEMEKPLVIPSAAQSGKYALFVDPLDGSSNVDVNAPLGSIFSVHRLSTAESSSEKELFKPGVDQVASGYLLYGASTILVYTCGAGVYQFTLDPGIGEFLLSAQQITIPNRGNIYSANEGNYLKWTSGTQRFVDYVRGADDSAGRPYASRYTGCLVADVHRILLKGGIYLYPGEAKNPEGKLRLMYEAAPLSFLMEQAGGLGSAGSQCITGIQPTALHQRVPLLIGSREDVEMAERFIQGQG